MEEVNKQKQEQVNHPSHYNQGKYEVIDVIEDWKLGFCLGNAVKYIARCRYKRNKKEDLEKAIWYLQYELKKKEPQEKECMLKAHTLDEWHEMLKEK